MKRTILTTLIVLIMCVGLCGCNRDKYDEAVKLQESGKYAEAAAIFDELGNYEDSLSKYNECIAFDAAVGDFYNAIAQLEKRNSELDKAVFDAEHTLSKEVLDKNLQIKLVYVIKDAKQAKKSVPTLPESLEEIEKYTKNAFSVDYSDAIDELSKACLACEYSNKQFLLVNNPPESRIIDRLKKIDGIIEIAAATEENDPNGQLGKARGYTAAVYFSYDKVDQSKVYGTDIIDKGTSCGGQIEVYRNAEDAEKRNNYLATFDGSVLSSGSHTVIGTLVIRTSDELTASQQKSLEAELINALTLIE